MELNLSPLEAMIVAINKKRSAGKTQQRDKKRFRGAYKK
jgi:hypothetical protein